MTDYRRQSSKWKEATALAVLMTAAMLPIRAAAAPVLTLSDAIDRALHFAPSVAIAAANSDLGYASADAARAPLYPALNGDLEYYQPSGYSKVITNGGLSAADITMTYTAYDFGRRLATARAARYRSEAARFGVRAAQDQIVFDTSVAYFDLLRRRQAVGELRRNLGRLNRYVAVIKSLERTGKAITNDVLRMRSARDAAELTLASAQQASQQAAIMLGSLIGDFQPANVEIEDVNTLPPLGSGRLTHNPALQADQRVIDSTALAVKAAQAERYPQFNITLSTGFLGINPPNTFNHNFGASYDGAFGVPIFTGGLIKAHVDQASAREMMAKARLKQDELTLSRRLADAATRYHQARRQLAILTRSQPTANDAFALDWTRFLGGGNVTLLEVLAAHEQAESFRLMRFDQQFAVRQAAAETALLYGEGR